MIYLWSSCQISAVAPCALNIDQMSDRQEWADLWRSTERVVSTILRSRIVILDLAAMAPRSQTSTLGSGRSHEATTAQVRGTSVESRPRGYHCCCRTGHGRMIMTVRRSAGPPVRRSAGPPVRRPWPDPAARRTAPINDESYRLRLVLLGKCTACRAHILRSRSIGQLYRASTKAGTVQAAPVPHLRSTSMR